MATTIATGYANAPLKQGEPPDFGFLYSGKALEFDGVADYVTFDSITLDGDFTFATWMKIDAFTQYLPFISTTANGNHFIGFRYNTAASLYLRFSDAGGAVPNVPTAIFAGVWHRVVLVRDASESEIYYYVDGALIDTIVPSDFGLTSGSITDDIVVSAFGGWGSTPGYFADYNLSDYQVWDDEAWSLLDVQYDYDHPEQLPTVRPKTTLSESNLKLWLPMNEGNPRSPQTTVYDATPRQFGIELWDTDSSTFTVGGTHLGSSVETTDCYGWQKIGTNTIANVSGELRITYGDDGAGARSYLRDTYDLNGDLDTTKTYKLQFDAYADTDTNVKMTNNYFAWESEVFTTVKTTFVIYFVPNHATNMSLQLSAFSEGNVFLDNMSLKPVNGNPGQLK